MSRCSVLHSGKTCRKPRTCCHPRARTPTTACGSSPRPASCRSPGTPPWHLPRVAGVRREARTRGRHRAGVRCGPGRGSTHPGRPRLRGAAPPAGRSRGAALLPRIASQLGIDQSAIVDAGLGRQRARLGGCAVGQRTRGARAAAPGRGHGHRGGRRPSSWITGGHRGPGLLPQRRRDDRGPRDRELERRYSAVAAQHRAVHRAVRRAPGHSAGRAGRVHISARATGRSGSAGPRLPACLVRWTCKPAPARRHPAGAVACERESAADVISTRSFLGPSVDPRLPTATPVRPYVRRRKEWRSRTRGVGT